MSGHRNWCCGLVTPTRPDRPTSSRPSPSLFAQLYGERSPQPSLRQRTSRRHLTRYSGLTALPRRLTSLRSHGSTDNMHGCAIAQRALCEFRGRFGALRVITHVMTAASIGASRGGGYARYLESKTVEPERGDYYLTPDGEMAQAPGRWLADPGDPGAARGSGRRAGGWRGLHRADGGPSPWHRPVASSGGRWRRPGWRDRRDVQRPEVRLDRFGRSAIRGSASRSRQAHARAVEQTVGYLREQVPVVRRRYSGQVVEEHAKDVIAAEYRHTTARGVRGAAGTGPAAAQSCRHHWRRPGGRADRRGRFSADLPVRPGAGRVLPLRAR